MSPPGRRSALGGGSESAPGSFAGDDTTLSHDRDIVPLKHGMAAIYVRDNDLFNVALRKMRRRVPLTGIHLAAYEAWLAEQRRDAS